LTAGIAFAREAPTPRFKELHMQTPPAYEDAVDLLDADHQAVKSMFIDYAALCEDDAPAEAKQALAERICQALTVHAQLEEELFYPAVREALSDQALLDRALAEHAGAKETIERIQGMTAEDAAYDDAVLQLGKMIDQHVLEEREQIFLQARYAALDLRGLVPPMAERQRQLKQQTATAAVEEAA
jgi:Hemerythrin HHE cation binding domain